MRSRSPRFITIRPVWAAAIALLAAGCGARNVAVLLEPGYERGGVPDLAGARVMVFPLQGGGDAYPDLDTEIEYALGQAVGEATWLFSGELEEALSRNPGTELSVRNLPVRRLLLEEVERIPDPLFGQVYRFGALTGASYALLPIEVQATQGVEGSFLELTSVLVDARSGYILWLGVVRGTEGEERELVRSATVAAELARRVGQ